MCLAILALRALPGLPVLIAGNRDEYHARPTAPAARWEDHPDIVAGRDLRSGGTWMGMTLNGRYALVTNYRDPTSIKPGAPSRGALVDEFLHGTASPADYAAQVDLAGPAYNGFNLIVGNLEDAWYCSNRGAPARRLAPGVYALSNHLLDTPWPKLARTKAAFGKVLQAGGPHPDVAALLQLLGDRSPAADDELPETGVGLERERFLSSAFIVGETYGTRSSTVMALDQQHCALHEVRFAPDGVAAGRVDLSFPVSGGSIPNVPA
jgi:uncharacterized protein with NRDE domain